MDIIWDDNEDICKLPYVDDEERFAYSYVYGVIDKADSRYIIVGCVVISDHQMDNHVCKFFSDDPELDDFFMNEIIVEPISEEWLVDKVFETQGSDRYFLREPFFIRGDSAKTVSDKLYEAAERKNFVVIDPKVSNFQNI